MRSKYTGKLRYNITTLGCSKNLVDSEQLAKQIQANNKGDVYFEEYNKKYDISIINTCGFIDKAKEESIQTILEHIDKKKKGNIKKIFVFGCLIERYKTELQKSIPEIDGYFGTNEFPFILNNLKMDYKENLLGERMLSQAKHYAYLKISEGCNRTCSFCAIPQMRGSHISKPIETIIQEATLLAQSGVKEIILIAQELTYYGIDIYKKRMLPKLLNELCNIKNIEWIRLHYTYPTKFPMKIIDVIKNQQKICNYLDIPLQHASNNILQSMKRQTSQEEQQRLINNIRNIIPDIAIRTTMMVGFPNETQEDFEILKNFIVKNTFERLGVFTYSHEDKTQAAHLKDNISQEVKQQRAEELMNIQKDISYKHNLKKINNIYKVLIDKYEAGIYVGRTEQDSVEVDNEVLIRTDKKLQIGSFVKVKIIDAMEYDLEAKLVL